MDVAAIGVVRMLTHTSRVVAEFAKNLRMYLSTCECQLHTTMAKPWAQTLLQHNLQIIYGTPCFASSVDTWRIWVNNYCGIESEITLKQHLMDATPPFPLH